MTAELMNGDGKVEFRYDFDSEGECVAFLTGLCLALDLPVDWMGVTLAERSLTWQWQGTDVYEVLKLDDGLAR